MNLILLTLVVMVLSGCATPRVLVKDCKDAGPGLMNCEKVTVL